MIKKYCTALIFIFFGFICLSVCSDPIPNVASLAENSGKEASSGFNIIADGSSSLVSLTHKKSIGDDSGSKDLFYMMSLSSPIDKDKDLDHFANLESIVKGTEFKLGFERWSDNTRRIPSSAEMELAIQMCEKAKERYTESTGLEANNDQCDNPDFMLKYFSKSDYYKKDALFWEDKTDWAIGIMASIGHEKYDYADPENYSNQNTNENPWSVELYGVSSSRFPFLNKFIPANDEITPAVFIFGISYRENFKEREAQVLCIDPGSDPLSCKSYKLGMPIRKESKLAYLEYRSFWGNTAFSLRLTHDFKSDNDGIDLPIFFFKDKDSNWSGGLRLGWTKEDKEQLALFVGKSFDLYSIE